MKLNINWKPNLIFNVLKDRTALVRGVCLCAHPLGPLPSLLTKASVLILVLAAKWVPTFLWSGHLQRPLVSIPILLDTLLLKHLKSILFINYEVYNFMELTIRVGNELK